MFLSVEQDLSPWIAGSGRKRGRGPLEEFSRQARSGSGSDLFLRRGRRKGVIRDLVPDGIHRLPGRENA
jgi:hypothetical protein